MEWAQQEPSQTIQPATALDAPHGRWQDDKQRARPKHLEDHRLDRDMVCLPPVDIDRQGQETMTNWDDIPLGAARYARYEDQNTASGIPFPPDTAPRPQGVASQGERAGVTITDEGTRATWTWSIWLVQSGERAE